MTFGIGWHQNEEPHSKRSFRYAPLHAPPSVCAPALARLLLEVFHDRDATEPKLVLVDARRSYVNNKGETVSEDGEPIGESNTESDDFLTQFRTTPTYDLRVMDPIVLYDEVNEETGETDPEASTYSEEIEWFMRRLPAPGP